MYPIGWSYALNPNSPTPRWTWKQFIILNNKCSPVGTWTWIARSWDRWQPNVPLCLPVLKPVQKKLYFSANALHINHIQFTPQIVTGTETGNLYFWDGIHSFHAKYLVQIEEAHDLAVLSCHFSPCLQGRSITLTFSPSVCNCVCMFVFSKYLSWCLYVYVSTSSVFRLFLSFRVEYIWKKNQRNMYHERQYM